MAVTIEDIKKLRERTGAGMADCKKALEDAGGDMNGAIELLRKKGAAMAAKRSDRSANEGIVAVATSPDHKRSAIVEMNCETDFVARNEEFSTFARQVAEYILNNEPADMETLLKGEVEGRTVEAGLNELLAKFGEKIEVRRYEVIKTDAGYIAEYIHGGDKLGVLVELSATADDTTVVDQVGRDIAMQVAAMNPAFVRREEVPGSVLDKERDIYREQAEREGKKPEIAEKIVENRIEKYYGESCLIEQVFVKDSGKSVSDLLAESGKSLGTDMTVIRFVRFNLGEEIDEPAATE